MKAIGLAASIVALVSSGALAADVFGGDKSLKDDSNYAQGTIVNWSGPYIGGSVGYGIITATGEDSPVGLSFESPLLNAVAGYDIASGRFVFGPFVEYTYITADEAEDITDWGVGLRGGIVVAPRTLLYTSLAFTQLSGEDEEVNGVRGAVGTEFALTGNLFADLKVDYTWYDLEDANDVADAGALRAMAGLKLKLGGFGR